MEDKKPLFMISTCGTSLLTNGASSEERALLVKNANASERELSQDTRETIKKIAERQFDTFHSLTDNAAKELSAELSGILAYLNLFPERKINAIQALLISSTYQGQLIEDALLRWLTARGHNATILEIPDIVTSPLQRFQSGLCGLVDYCATYLDKEAQYIVFNVTGGFKSVQGFLQTLGLFYADECISIFENREDLLRIPRLPAQIDADPLIRENVDLFRRMNAGSVAVSEAVRLPETLLTIVGEEVTLSGWGKLMWTQTKGQIYSERIWPIMSKKLELGETFLRTCDRLDAKRKRILNERLDDLRRHLESESGQNLRSLDFKPLHQNAEVKSQHGGMTHEFDAWADLDAKRCFGFFDERGIFIVAKLVDALH